MPDFDYQGIKDGLRGVIKATWDIEDTKPIPETGGEPIKRAVLANALDTAYLEHLDDPEYPYTLPLRWVGKGMAFRIWRLKKKVKSTKPLEAMLSDLKALEDALWADPRLGGLIDDLQVTEMDETGAGSEELFEIDVAAGEQSGSLDVQLFFSKVR